MLATRLPVSAVLSVEVAGVDALTGADDGLTAEGAFTENGRWRRRRRRRRSLIAALNHLCIRQAKLV